MSPRRGTKGPRPRQRTSPNWRPALFSSEELANPPRGIQMPTLKNCRGKPTVLTFLITADGLGLSRSDLIRVAESIR